MSSTSNASKGFYVQLIDKDANEVVSDTLPEQPDWPETVLYNGKVYTFAWSIEGVGWCYQEATGKQWDELSKK